MCKHNSVSWPAQMRADELALFTTEPANDVSGAYTQADYNSTDGIQSDVFGPPFWMVIHMLSFNYPVHPTPEQKACYRTWLEATGKVLPCRYCRDNFPTNYETASKNYSDPYASRDSFSRFCYDLHDEVNRCLGKQTPMSFVDLRDLYENFRARCTQKAHTGHHANAQELGCVVPSHSVEKGKCILAVVPRGTDAATFSVAKVCRDAACSK
jgi:hypothetical protein